MHREVVDQNNLESKLITREAYWTAQVRTLRPCGLNKRQEFKSKYRNLSLQIQAFYLFLAIFVFYIFNIPNKNHCK